MLPTTAVVILNWNGWYDTVDLLVSLNVSTYEPLLVIVIDNASTDQSVAHIKAWFINNNLAFSSLFHRNPTSSINTVVPLPPIHDGKHFLLIESDHNLGFCVGNNLGMAYASQLGAKYILILNNDTFVSPDFLEPMVDIAERDSQVGLVGGVILYGSDQDIIWWAGGRFTRFLNAIRVLDGKTLDQIPAKSSLDTQWVSGCMMLIPTRIYHAFGGYAEEYFIWSEEWDYSLKVSYGGFRHKVATKSRIYHKVGRSLGIMKPLNYYYGLRNGLLFKRKYLPWYLWYPYLIYYLISRVARFSQLAIQGRTDLVRAGIAAVADFFLGRNGIWSRQQT